VIDPHVGNGLLTAAEAAHRCKISVYTFNEKARAGLIPRVQLGGRKGVRYLVEDIDAFILSRRNEQ
jgi:predicted DNA-binding transcriptional regulator AlpA